MAKIQDVTVNQTLGQRMLGVGDLVLEDSGQRGGMVIRNLDSPREIADAIIVSYVETFVQWNVKVNTYQSAFPFKVNVVDCFHELFKNYVWRGRI